MVNGVQLLGLSLVILVEFIGVLVVAFTPTGSTFVVLGTNRHIWHYRNVGHEHTKCNYEASNARSDDASNDSLDEGDMLGREDASSLVGSNSSNNASVDAPISSADSSNIVGKGQSDTESENNREIMNDPTVLSSPLAPALFNNTSSRFGSKQSTSLNAGIEGPQKTLTTESLTGGQSLMFAMARRMLFWDDETDGTDGSSSQEIRNEKKNRNNKSLQFRRIPRSRDKILPRWRPHDGIADANPSFRMHSPAMNNKGYASIIRRNSRKRGKVSLWRHAVRVYDKMKAEELEQQHQVQTKQRNPSDATILRTTEHFEAVSVACAKLGLWRETIGIYREIIEKSTVGGRNDLAITDNLILSIVSACVKASKMRKKQKFEEKEQRMPLDAARDILDGLEVNHGLSLEPRHINPLAAAYQHLGLTAESSQIVRKFLDNRFTEAPINVDDIDAKDKGAIAVMESTSKDKASYNILVQGAILEGNWTTAIDSLRNMTEAGLYPNSRNLNIWSETAKKRELGGGGRRMRSWKKKRERMLVRGTLPPVGAVRGNMPPKA